MTRKFPIKERIVKGYWSLVAMSSVLILTLQPVMAESIFDRFSKIMKDVYGQLVGISTIVAVTAAAVAYLQPLIAGGNYNG